MGTKVITGRVRFVYFNGFKAKLNELSGKSEFSTRVLVDKKDVATVKALKDAINEALATKFSGKRPPGARSPLKDGDAPVAEGSAQLGDEYIGHYYFSAKCGEDRGPQVVDADGQDVLSAKEFGSGDYGRVSVTAFGYDHKVNKGVSFWLNNVQFLDKGTPLDGHSSALNDFGAPAKKATVPSKKAAVVDEVEPESESDDDSAWA